MLFPSWNDFIKKFKSKKNIVVYHRLTADLETAVSLMIKLTDAKKNTFLLESVSGGEIKGRYSIIGMEPDLIWECRGKKSRIKRKIDKKFSKFKECKSPPLKALRSVIAESQIELPKELPQMASGLFGYLGYDMIRLVEKLPNINQDSLNLPDSVMIRPQIIVIIDNVKGDVIIVTPVWSKNYRTAELAYSYAQQKINTIIKKLGCQIKTDKVKRDSLPENEKPQSNVSKDQYLKTVEMAKQHILEGEIFQVVASQRWSLSFNLPPFSLYRALRRTNHSPYMFFFNLGSYQVVGASPEILVKVQNKKVTIRPIAGTRPRGKTSAEDKEFENDLLNDPKEKAEHLMLLDLGRNDAGKVSKIGSVVPTEKFTIEKYSHVMHIVSNVEGELRDDQDALSALLSGLPAGTVSGAPKVRAMEIIDELETEKRGVYGGGIGYFGANGEMDICIALRTGIIKNETLFVQAGGGIVFDSDPESEFLETVNKSQALIAAAREAKNFVSIID